MRTTLDDIAALGEDWDTYGAPPIDAGAIERVRALLPALAAAGLPEPWLVPTSRGGIALEWRGDGNYTDLEVGP